MKVIFKDLKHGEIKLMPENLDDIWHLYNIIDEGDLVRAVTFRTDDQKDDKIRSKKVEKKPMKVGIRVSEVKFHEFSDRLRIHGKIEEGPQDLGSFHTLNIDSDKMNKLSIVKEQWQDHQLQRIDEAVKQSSQVILTFVSLDEDEATVAVLRQSGVQWIADMNILVM
jgi:protein pelota